MPVQTLNKLTDSYIRAFKADRQVRLSDGGNLYLVVSPSGRKVWAFVSKNKAGKTNSRNIGEYPSCGLSEARKRAADLRDQLQGGIDPVSVRDRKEPLSKWIDIVLNGKEDGTLYGKARSASTVKRDRFSLVPVIAAIGKEDVRSLTISKLDDALKKVEGGESRYRARHLLQEVFRWITFRELIKFNPAAGLDVVYTQPTGNHYSAFFEPEKIGDLLVNIQKYKSAGNVDVALELLLRTAMRSGELRLAKWDWIDMKGGVLALPAAVTKTRTGRNVYLSSQSIALFHKLRAQRNNYTDFVFPAVRSFKGIVEGGKPLTDSVFTQAIRSMGYTSEALHVHGFRAMCSTVVNESGLHRYDVVEAFIGHAQKGVRAVYNRGDYAQEQKALATWWSNWLDQQLAKLAWK